MGETGYAYATFLLGDGRYLPGALLFAYGLRCQGAVADILCIVSGSLPQEARDALLTLYDDAVAIDPVHIPHRLGQQRQDLPLIFTRLNVLLLGRDGTYKKAYDKVAVADSDILPLTGYDTLFDVDTPAGCINERKEYCMEYDTEGRYVIPDTYYATGEWNWHTRYACCPHGAPIPRELTNRVAEDVTNMGVNGALYVFTPSAEEYRAIMEDLAKPEIRERINAYRWPDMQYLTLRYSGAWHNIDIKYASFHGYPEISGLFGIHYAGLNPWNLRHKSIECFGRYEDYKLWYAAYLAMMERYPGLQKNKRLAKLKKGVEELTNDSRYRFQNVYLPNIRHLLI